jgi:uncharacterized RmlC-like cupin family protein
MVKTFESVIKAVNRNKRKWLLRLNQKVMEVGTALYVCAFVTHTPPGRLQAPNPICFARGTWKPRIAPFGDSRLQSLPMAVRV